MVIFLVFVSGSICCLLRFYRLLFTYRPSGYWLACCLSILFLLMVKGPVHGQDVSVAFEEEPVSGDSPNFIDDVVLPASPVAGQLGRYGAFEISKSAGTTDVSVPVMAIAEGGISIPITLSYQSTGLKVDERPSWVGMGWTLSVGGVITRSARGLCDDMTDGFLEHMTTIPSASTIHTDLSLPNDRDAVYNRLTAVANGKYDYLPDVFSFNFVGYGGSFFFGNDGLVHCEQHNSLKITPIFGTMAAVTSEDIIIGWEVIDENGLIYTFKAYETNRIRLRDEDLPAYISAWYLSTIYNPITEATAYFSYDPTVYEYEYTDHYTASLNYEKENSSTYFTQKSSTQSPLYVNHDGVKFLSSITLNDHRIEFTTSASEESFRRLNTITWTNGAASKTFSLAYYYQQRLLLTSLTEADEENPKVHSFSYYSGTLPARKSAAQDHWGYYNGATTNASLVPDITYAGEDLGGGANRSPALDYARIGMLKTITYPTRGTTTFSYEQNTWRDKTTAEDEDIVNVIPLNRMIVQGEENSTDGEVCGDMNRMLREGGDGDISETTDYTLVFKFQLVSKGSDNGKDYPTLAITAYRDVSGTTKTISLGSFKVKEGYILDSLGPDVLEPGDNIHFTVCAYGSSYDGYPQEAWLDVTVKEVGIKSSVGVPIGRKVGGLRVSQIYTHDLETGVSTYRTFDYGYGGYLVHHLPQYFEAYSSDEKTFVKVNGWPTGGIGPSPVPVAYDTVYEWYGTSAVNIGKVQTIYRREQDDVSLLKIAESNHSYRARVKRNIYFDSENEIVRTEDFQYYRKNIGNVKIFKAMKVRFSSSIDYLADFNYANTYHYGYWDQLSSKITAEYLGDDVLSDTIQYEYGSSLHVNPTRILTNNSKAEQVDQQFVYPIDVSSCENTCYSDYYADLSSCDTTTQVHSLAASACLGKYYTCNQQYLFCKQAESEDVNENCDGAIPCRARKAKLYACHEVMKSCLNTTDGYFQCLDGLDESYAYEACQTNAFLTYRLCQSSYQDCLLDAYESAVDFSDRGEALLNLANIRTTPIEIIKSNSHQGELSSTLWKYGVWNEKPLSQEVSIGYEGGKHYPIITKDEYDQYGNPLEIFDYRTGVTKSYVWGYGSNYLIAEFSGAAYADIGYTSFEADDDEGNLGFNLEASPQAKTGEQAHYLNGQPVTKSGLDPTKRYVVSFWSKEGEPAITGVVDVYYDGETDTDGWAFYEKVISGVASFTITGDGDTIIDEVRVSPEGCLTTTFTHRPGYGVTSITDANNITAYYEYNTAGQLKVVKDNYHQIIKYLKYHYKE